MNHKSRRIPRNALFKTWSQYRLYHEIVCFCWPTMQYMYVFSVASAEWIQSQFSVLLIMAFPNNNNIENCINIISLYDYKTNINIKYDKHVTICNAFSITNVYTIRELSHYQHHHCQRCRCRRRRCRLVPFVSHTIYEFDTTSYALCDCGWYVYTNIQKLSWFSPSFRLNGRRGGVV